MKNKGFKERTSLSKVKLNPFELHINHSKHTILGQKSKDDHGLPGVSRGKAYRKREKTLLGEYRDRHKTGKVLDLRIGEKNKFLDPEKKIMLRMTAEKKRQFSKKSLYNLNDDEQLMHGGKALNEASMKESAFSDEEEEDDLLDANFVSEQHFGGDIFTKHTGRDHSEGHQNSGNKNRKEWIEEIIAESKKKKAENKKDREIQNDAVSKLDAKFQDFLSLLKGKTLTDDDKEKSKKNCEFREYDMYVREVAFDRSKRANPMNRLETEEELAKEQEERLRTLEDERRRRMKGETETNSRSTSQSADALADGLVLWSPKNKEDNLKQRKASSSVHVSLCGRAKADATTAEAEEDAAAAAEGSESEGEESSGDESDNYSDVLEDSNSEEEEEEEEEEEARAKKGEEGSSKRKARDGGAADAACSAKVDGELPFTFEVPGDYDGFWELLARRTPAQVSTVVARMLACNHPKLGADNKTKANTINAYILQTLHILCSPDPEWILDSTPPLRYVDPLVAHLYALTQLNPPDSASALTQVIDEKYEDYSKNPKKYPFADTFIFLKASGLLFPASDYHHDVMTRVITFLTHVLGEGKVRGGRDVLALLFTASLLFEYLCRSCRFVGELLNALNGVLYTCIPAKGPEDLHPTPPFKVPGSASEILVLEKRVRSYKSSKLKFSMLNEEIKLKDSLKIIILNETLKLMDRLCRKWSNLPSARAVFLPTSELLVRIPLSRYPSDTETLVRTLQTTISELPKQIPHLAKADTLVKTLRMLEPVAEEIVEGIKKRGGSKDFQEKSKLLHKLKRERKGAKRELKRDAQFIAREQLGEVLASDAERKRKVNLIMQGLATQESEFKKLKSQK